MSGHQRQEVLVAPCLLTDATWWSSIVELPMSSTTRPPLARQAHDDAHESAGGREHSAEHSERLDVADVREQSGDNHEERVSHLVAQDLVVR